MLARCSDSVPTGSGASSCPAAETEPQAPNPCAHSVTQACPTLWDPKDYSPTGSSVHGVVKSRTRLNDFTFTFHFHALEKEMATDPSVLAWRIPGIVEPGGLPSMGLHRVGHD